MNRFWLLSASLLPFAAFAAPCSVSQTPRPVWAHLVSDLPVDPAVRFGQLTNGMRYAIRRNATPPGEASFRLRIDAGSLNEREDQRGIAHFLEHMVLNGTRNVPEGDFVRRLERAGLRFGPDTNASTDFEQTVFKLDLPRTDAATVGEALFLLREVIDEATLDAKAIDSERGIILSEERTRASPGYRAVLDEYAFALRGQRLPTRFPIGDTGVIRGAPRERFVEFYNGYYRPERATLIAVGDFDVADMEARIRKAFDGWKPEGPALADADEGTPASRPAEARLLVEAGLPHRVSLAWVRPADLRPDMVALRRESAMEGLALGVFNRRLQRLAALPNPPFAGAGAGRGSDARSAERTGISAIAAPGRWRDALAAITAEQRRLVRYGVTQEELDREIADARSAYKSAVAGAATRNTRSLAEGLVGIVNDDDVVTTPESALVRFEDTVRGLTAAGVNAAIPALFSGAGPLVYMTSPVPVEGGEVALRATYDRAVAGPVAPPIKVATLPWPYQNFGEPGRVVERREIGEGIGATAVRFANGTRLTVKKTAFKDDEILVGVRFGAGRMDLPRDGKATPEWGAGGAVTEGGVGKMTREQIRQTLSSNIVSAGFDIDDDSLTLGGATRPEDFALELKLLTAFYTDPAWRPTGWDRLRSLADTIHDGAESTPGGIFTRDAGVLLRGGDSRWLVPSRAEMKAMDIGAARAVLAPRFGREPVEVVIVGDVDVEEAIRQTAATFGALTTTPARPPMTTAAPSFPAPTAQPVRLVHKGRADQGLAYIAWPTTGFYKDMKQARILSVLSDVFQLRLTDEIREKQGTTYSPSAGHVASDAFADYGLIYASIQAAPDKLPGFLADAERIARELRDKPVTADELDRARKPTLASISRTRASSNGWWMGALDRIQTDSRVALTFRTQIADYESVTPADLQAVARKFLVDTKDWKLVVVPEATPAIQASTGAPAAR